MKKVFLTLFVILSVLSVSAQYEYKGPLTEKVFSEMTPFEKILYIDCLKEFDAEGNEIKWVSDKTLKNLKRSKKYYFGEICSTDNVSERIDRQLIAGMNRLKEPEYLISIRRKSNVSEVSLTMYY